MKYLDLAKTFLEGIEGGIFEISACFLLASFGISKDFLLNREEIYYLNLLLVINLFYSDLYITVISFQATKPKFIIWEMSLADLLSNSYCLINVAILSREHAFFALPVKNSLISNKEIEAKLLYYSCGSAGWLAWYRVTKDSKLRKDTILLVSVL